MRGRLVSKPCSICRSRCIPNGRKSVPYETLEQETFRPKVRIYRRPDAHATFLIEPKRFYLPDRVAALTDRGLIDNGVGVDLERDILAQMQFRPGILPAFKAMDPRIFRPEAMGLAAILSAHVRPVRSQRLNRFFTKAVS